MVRCSRYLGNGLASVAFELSGVKAGISALRSEVGQSISETKADLIRWVVAVGILQMALVAGLVVTAIP